MQARWAIWRVIWMVVATLALIAVMSGRINHIITLILALTMVGIAGRGEDENRLNPS